MPGGLVFDNPLSYLAFAGIKLAAYTGYAAVLDRFPGVLGHRTEHHHENENDSLGLFLAGRLEAGFRGSSVWRVSPFWVGLARTALGMLVGSVFLYGTSVFNGVLNIDVRFWWLLLVLIRAGEWWLILTLFLDKPQPVRRWAIAMVLGIVVSFLADIPAMAGWLLAGGYYIC